MLRASRRLRFLVVLVITCLVSGFKLAVVVDEVGAVKSKSDTRNCHAGSTCVFEVNDNNFIETFTATPLPGYMFTKWAGPTWLCRGQTGPTCKVSPSGAKNPTLMNKLIASDATVSLKPIFTKVTGPVAKAPSLRYVVKDSTGAILGNVTDFNYESVTVRLVHVDEQKKAHGYLLVFDNDSVAPLKSNTLVWDNSSCNGSNAFMLIPEPYHFMEPLLSNDYQVINESPEANGIFSLVQIAPRDEARQLPKPYAKYGDVCQPWGGTAKGVPATIVIHDLGAVFKPPFGLFAE
jgi:hypothetical protein